MASSSKIPVQYLLNFKLSHYKKPDEKIGRLLVVLVDGPQSLSLHQAARRLGLPHAVAKAELKNYRRLILAEKRSLRAMKPTPVLSELQIKSDAQSQEKNAYLKISLPHQANAHSPREPSLLTEPSHEALNISQDSSRPELVFSGDQLPAPIQKNNASSQSRRLFQSPIGNQPPTSCPSTNSSLTRPPLAFYTPENCIEAIAPRPHKPTPQRRSVNSQATSFANNQSYLIKEAPPVLSNPTPPSNQIDTLSQLLRQLPIDQYFLDEQYRIQTNIESLTQVIQGHLQQAAQRLHGQLQALGCFK